MFRRKPPVELDLDEDAYARWLRAQRPDLLWFLRLAPDEQEVLAQIGDDHAHRTALDIGYAVQDPQAAEAGLSAGSDVGAEEVLARKVAARLLNKMIGPAQATPPAQPPANGPSLFGRKPDGEATG